MGVTHKHSDEGSGVIEPYRVYYGDGGEEIGARFVTASSIARQENSREPLGDSARHEKAEYRASRQATRLSGTLTEFGSCCSVIRLLGGLAAGLASITTGQYCCRQSASPHIVAHA
jgi:hypothetical protein